MAAFFSANTVAERVFSPWLARSNGTMSGVDAGLAAVLGAFAGGGITGVVSLGSVYVNNRFQTQQAMAQREHERDESREARAHDHVVALRADRRALIKEWRVGLAEAYRAWDKWDENIADADEIARKAWNIVGTEWFESLRPLLQDSGETVPKVHGYRTAKSLDCDGQVVVNLSLEIARIEREWFGD